ncbi:MAG: YggT family protein [Bacillota bacterium]
MGTMQILLLNAVDMFFRVVEMLIFATILLSWLPIGRENALVGMLHSLTDPILMPCRKMLENSPLGRGMMLDFSPIIALILLSLIKQFLQSAIYMVF